MENNLYTNTKVQEGLMEGISIVANAVRGTLGPSGYNAIIESPLPPFSIITNDGISIAEAIKFEDPLQNIGGNLIKEAMSLANRESGDGSTTTAVLTKAILEEGLTVKASPMEVKRSLDECLPIILDSIDSQTKEITVDEIEKVAFTSSEDKELSKTLQEIYQKIGKDGIVELDTSNLSETFYEIKEGVRLRGAGFMYPYMANDLKGKTATYLVPKILITKEKIATIPQIDPIFKALHEKGVNELVIFCDEIDPSVSSYLANGHVQGAFKTLVIKAPTLWKDWLFEDFAKITGATIIGSSPEYTLKRLRLEHLGSCDKILSTKEETTVLGIHDITAHLENLKQTDTDESKLRIAWLTTKAAVLKLGANSEAELSYKRLKAEDARNASYLALQHGVVKGGGLTLANIKLPTTLGGEILTKALTYPYKQLCENMGASELEVKDDVLDASVIVKNCVKYALSVAGTVLTAKIVVKLNKEK